MSIYFDRSLPLYLTDEPTYMGVKVDVDADSLQIVMDLNALVAQIEARITDTGSPEDYNQELAETFTAGLREIWESNYAPRHAIADVETQLDPSPSIPTEGN